MSAAEDNLVRVALEPLRFRDSRGTFHVQTGYVRRSGDDEPATLYELIALGAFRQPNRDELSLHVHSSSLSLVNSGVHSASVTFSVQRYGACSHSASRSWSCTCTREAHGLPRTQNAVCDQNESGRLPPVKEFPAQNGEGLATRTG